MEIWLRGLALTSHIEGSMATAIWTHLWMFLNSKCQRLNVQMLKSAWAGARGNWTMNWLNENEPAMFSISSFWTFLWSHFFSVIILLYKKYHLCILSCVVSTRQNLLYVNTMKKFFNYCSKHLNMMTLSVLFKV
jgi:hypothetical protein